MVIGGGAAGLSAARAARAEGAARVALVERGRLGGECLHTGCVPSKALIEIANRFRDARSGAALGLRADGLTLDFPTAMAHVRGIIDEIGRDDSAETLQAAGIHVLNGEARFTSARDLEIDGARHTFGRAVIATGSDPGVPAGLGLERTPHLTNENVFGLEELPRRLAVLGGGPIGLELGQAFARLGSEVTVIEVRDRLLPGEDARVGPIVRAALQEDGVTVRTGATVRRVVHDGANLTIEIDERGGGDRVTADRLLVAAGRTPRTARLGLEEIGVAMGPEGIEVDERRRTSVKGIYACGDVTTAPRFTHVGAYDGVVAGRNAAGKRAKADHRVLPWIIFTDPVDTLAALHEPDSWRLRRDVDQPLEGARDALRALGTVKYSGWDDAARVTELVSAIATEHEYAMMRVEALDTLAVMEAWTGVDRDPLGDVTEEQAVAAVDRLETAAKWHAGNAPPRESAPKGSDGKGATAGDAPPAPPVPPDAAAVAAAVNTLARYDFETLPPLRRNSPLLRAPPRRARVSRQRARRPQGAHVRVDGALPSRRPRASGPGRRAARAVRCHRPADAARHARRRRRRDRAFGRRAAPRRHRGARRGAAARARAAHGHDLGRATRRCAGAGRVPRERVRTVADARPRRRRPRRARRRRRVAAPCHRQGVRREPRRVERVLEAARPAAGRRRRGSPPRVSDEAPTDAGDEHGVGDGPAGEQRAARTSWLSVLFKLVGAALLVWILFTVPWRDRVRLADGTELAGRIVGTLPQEWAPGDVVVFRPATPEDAPERRLTAADLATTRVGERALPDVQEGLLRIARKADRGLLALGFVLFFVFAHFGVARWWLLLRGQGIRIPFLLAHKLTFVGFFFNNILFGSTGGDVVKALYVSRSTDRKTAAFLTVLVDRVAGVIALALIAAAFLLPRVNDPAYRPVVVLIGTFLGAVVVGGVLFFSRRLRRAVRYDAIVDRLPGGGLLRRIDEAMLVYRDKKRDLLTALLLSFGNQLAVQLVFVLFARSLHMTTRAGAQVPLSDFLVVLPAAWIVAAVPGPPGAWGTREAAFVYFFDRVGVARAPALALGVLGGVLMLGWGLLGGLYMLTDRGGLRRAAEQAARGAGGETEAAG